MEEKSLSGIGVVVTRPLHQAQKLIEGIRNLGGIPIVFPVLEIRDIADKGTLMSLIDRIDEFDWAIFVSPNAVEKAMDLIVAHGPVPKKLKFAVVGKSSLSALQRYGVGNIFLPKDERFDSEGLLDLNEMNEVNGAKIVIFRGNGGRELIGETLHGRGAEVHYAECYHRVKPDADATILLDALHNDELHAVTATSGESLENLVEMAGQWVKDELLFVTHPRIKMIAEKMGFEEVILTKSGDEGLLQGLAEWFGKDND